IMVSRRKITTAAIIPRPIAAADGNSSCGASRNARPEESKSALREGGALSGCRRSGGGDAAPAKPDDQDGRAARAGDLVLRARLLLRVLRDRALRRSAVSLRGIVGVRPLCVSRPAAVRQTAAAPPATQASPLQETAKQASPLRWGNGRTSGCLARDRER